MIADNSSIFAQREQQSNKSERHLYDESTDEELSQDEELPDQLIQTLETDSDEDFEEF
jgi:hypothetical protein